MKLEDIDGLRYSRFDHEVCFWATIYEYMLMFAITMALHGEG